MKDNSRFVLAIHILTLLAQKRGSLSSAFIAGSAGVNAVTVRKVVKQLREAKLVETQTGARGGITIAQEPSQITLKDTFLAVRDESLFGAFPDSPNQQCTVGRNLRPTLMYLLEDATQNMLATLATISIEDVLNGVTHPEE